MTEPSAVGLRLRSARAKEKGRALVAEVFTDPAVTRCVLIGGNRDGSLWTVVPVGMGNRDLAEAMLAGAHAVQRMLEHETALAGRGQPVRIEISERGDGPQPGASKPLAREVSIGPDGTLQPPEPEQFMACGSCGAMRWYVTVSKGTGYVARLACAGCANEIALHPTTQEGHA